MSPCGLLHRVTAALVPDWVASSRGLNGLTCIIRALTALASRKDVAPVFRSQFRSQSRSPWSSGFAAAVYALVLPTTGLLALAGHGESRPPQSRENKSAAAQAQPAPPKAVVVVTGTLDLGKITIADFGDVEPAER